MSHDAIESLARRWRRRERTAAGLRALSILLPLVGVAAAFWVRGAESWAAVVMLVAMTSGALAWWHWLPTGADALAIARHLDRLLPDLEESCELLLTPADQLPLVSRLQRSRAQEALARVESEADVPAGAMRRAAIHAAVSILVALAIPLTVEGAARLWTVSPVPGATETGVGAPAGSGMAGVGVRTTIDPPAYTGLESRVIEGLNLSAEEGAEVTWRIETPGDVVEAILVFDEVESQHLTREGTTFRGSRTADETHLYRLDLVLADSMMVRGTYSRFEVVPDWAPEFDITTPEPFVELERQRGQILQVVVEARDDYGVGPAALVATVASGFGELVEFRERRMTFDRRDTGVEGAVRFVSRLDLDALGVQPGVELFFFAEGRDSRRPEPNVGRSATHIVRMPGDSTRSVGLSSRLPILRVPEFFRSQRQIILDTEKLLAEEEAITREEFVRRSESLGFDQRALRLRYGGLLGEEFESGRPAGAGEEEDHAEEGQRLDEMEPGGSEADSEEAFSGIPEGLAHEHDSAEISTYFDSEIKAQLKAALEEMWGSEGRLRTIEPRKALPFEYRALTLLKQVQQRSRLYVQKIGFEAPLLYPDEKRLSGELDEILTVRRSGRQRQQSLLEVRLALRALDRPGEVPVAELLPAVREASRRLASRARNDPSLNLDGLEGLRRWITDLEEGSEVPAEAEADVAAALWSLLPLPEPLPETSPAVQPSLADLYRLQLAEEGGR